MTRPDLEALAALLAKATPGPWEARGMTVLGPPEYTGVAMCYWPTLERDTPPITLANAALIVAAVNALPALIARVRQLERTLLRSTDDGSTHWDIAEVGAVCHDECAVAQIKAAALAMRERCALVADNGNARAVAAAIRALEA